MKIKHPIHSVLFPTCLGAALSLSLALFSQDLPLPMAGPLPASGNDSTAAPTSIIKPPVPGRAAIAPDQAELRRRELAILEMERRIVEEQVRLQIAEAHKNGTAGEIKKIIVLNGPVDTTVALAPKPPQHGEEKVALVGINDNNVAKSLEGFFGTPMTPESERKLLETVEKKLGTGHPDQKPVKVSIAGWWPSEGVMAVSVVSDS